MLCRRCPHHVRHGKVDAATNAITFRDKCALKIKDDLDCKHHPFPKVFDYQTCEVYKTTFKGSVDRNEVSPTKDFQYTDNIAVGSITDMELL